MTEFHSNGQTLDPGAAAPHPGKCRLRSPWDYGAAAILSFLDGPALPASSTFSDSVWKSILCSKRYQTNQERKGSYHIMISEVPQRAEDTNVSERASRRDAKGKVLIDEDKEKQEFLKNVDSLVRAGMVT